jgi:hypothetical protein
MTNTVILDIYQPLLAHTRVDCSQHFGAVEAVEALGYPVDDPDVFEAALDLLGLVVPRHLADGLHACPHCTLVAAPVWRAAA